MYGSAEYHLILENIKQEPANDGYPEPVNTLKNLKTSLPYPLDRYSTNIVYRVALKRIAGVRWPGIPLHSGKHKTRTDRRRLRRTGKYIKNLEISLHQPPPPHQSL